MTDYLWVCPYVAEIFLHHLEPVSYTHLDVYKRQELFIIAINDIFKGIQACIEKCLYVDDLDLFYSGSSTAMIKCKLKRAVNKITQNAENMGFCFSVVKTICIHFCRSQVKCPNLTQKINRYEIQYQREVPFLALLFDRQLT